MQSQMPTATQDFYFVATNTGINFTSSMDIEAMLDPNASYQVIPAITEVFPHNIWEVLTPLLEKSK